MSDDSGSIRKIPPGIVLVRRIRGKDWSLKTYRYTVLLITFIAYASYHASRKPSSIVKSVLDPEFNKEPDHDHDRDRDRDPDSHPYPWPVGDVFFTMSSVDLVYQSEMKNKGWYPFNGADGTLKLGGIDVAFLVCYSFGMYFAGHLGDRLDLRLFLTTGMIGSGIFVGVFGMGYFWGVHMFWFYLVMSMIAGLFQATGWPSVVAVIGNWFGKRKRGLIMGVWNAHTSIGNIVGSLLAASVLYHGWGWSFILPGGFIVFGGILVFLFLVCYPEDVGFPEANRCCDMNAESVVVVVVDDDDDEETRVRNGLVGVRKHGGGGGGGGGVVPSGRGRRTTSVGLVEACLIPGVIPFALCLFFAKLVAYTFLYWLPFYLSQTEIGGEYMSVKSAGNLSTLFDVGGIIGGILAGYISDKLRARAITAVTFLYAAIPSMILYRLYGGVSQTTNIVLMMIAGLFINGPYALITTAVSADLGTHKSLRGDSRALATVTSIIDGTGSVGAALGPLLTGVLSTKGWDAVFVMLIVGAFVAGLLLSRMVVTEIRERSFNRIASSSGQQQQEQLRPEVADDALRQLISDER